MEIVGILLEHRSGQIVLSNGIRILLGGRDRASRSHRSETRQGAARAGRASVRRARSEMVGWAGIEPPTPGFSVLGLGLRKCA